MNRASYYGQVAGFKNSISLKQKRVLLKFAFFFSNQRCTVHFAHWAKHDVLNKCCAALSSVSNCSLL